MWKIEHIEMYDNTVMASDVMSYEQVINEIAALHTHEGCTREITDNKVTITYDDSWIIFTKVVNDGENRQTLLMENMHRDMNIIMKHIAG